MDRTKSVVTLAGAAYLAPYLWSRDRYGLLDHVDLAVHEAGHVVFAPFGEFMGIAGGSLLQVIVPAAFVAYFWLRDERFSAFIVLLWLAQSLFNVARYMADARAQLLPLVGGEYVIHDWAWMLSRLQLLTRDTMLAAWLRVAASLVLFGAVAGALMESRSAPGSATESAPVRPLGRA